MVIIFQKALCLNRIRISKYGYLSDRRVGRARRDECNGASSGIVGHDRLPHVLLHVRNVAKVTNGANALREISTTKRYVNCT